LSGNNIFLFLLAVFISSCTVSKRNNGKQATGIPEKKPSQAVPKGEITEPVPSPSASKKNEYTIALLLPFESKKVYITDLMEASSYYFPEESQLSAEYLNGAMIALDSLKKLGMKTRLLVYDVGIDSSLIKSTLQKPELKKADLIIGPVGNNSLKLVSQFSMSNKIWLVSPFSANAISALPNPNYILANATMRSHCEKIYDYILKYDHPEKIFLLYRKKDQDIELVKYFKDYKASKTATGKGDIVFIELTDSSEKKYYQLKDMLSAEKKNIVIVVSNAEPFVRTVIKQLSTLSESYLLEVFGMPTWSNFDRIPADQFEITNTHFTQTFLLNKTSLQATRFKNSYTKKYNLNPTDYAVRGYDQIMYFGSLLMKGGTNLEDNFKKNEKDELAERFSIKEVSGETERILYFENKSVYFLKYEQGKLTRIPD
jgi:ABC-type branched-subunit amino acid transport system substrate-binding protein